METQRSETVVPRPAAGTASLAASKVGGPMRPRALLLNAVGSVGMPIRFLSRRPI
jgi:hypothetical protein